MGGLNQTIEKVAYSLKKYEFYIKMVLKFILAFVAFTQLSNDLGYMGLFNNIFVRILLSLACAIIPTSMFLLVVGLVAILHIYKLSLIMAIVALIFFLVIYLMYLKFAPEQGILLVAIPVLMPFNLHFILAFGAGILYTPFTIVPIIGGVVIRYGIQYMNVGGASMEASIDGVVDSVKSVFDGLLADKTMLVHIVALILIVVVAFVITRFSIDYAYYIAIGAAAVAGLVGFIGANAIFKAGASIGMVIVGVIISALIVALLQYMFHNLDFARRENLQFEDEEYFYYVKAIPKKAVIVIPEDEKKDSIKDALEMSILKGKEGDGIGFIGKKNSKKVKDSEEAPVKKEKAKKEKVKKEKVKAPKAPKEKAPKADNKASDIDDIFEEFQLPEEKEAKSSKIKEDKAKKASDDKAKKAQEAKEKKKQAKEEKARLKAEKAKEKEALKKEKAEDKKNKSDDFFDDFGAEAPAKPKKKAPKLTKNDDMGFDFLGDDSYDEISSDDFE